MLHEFLTSNRAVIIDRCRVMVASRSDRKTTPDEVVHGIPTFLDQVIETLTIEQTLEPQDDKSISARNARGEIASSVGTTAALHGRDLFGEGFTIEQVVRDYGDVCQAVTKLAIETEVPISVDEFRTFNRCLDNAIAGAVTEYAKHTPASIGSGTQTINLRHEQLAQELLNQLRAATLAVTAIKTGSVGTGGQTTAVLEERLTTMRNLIGRWLAEA